MNFFRSKEQDPGGDPIPEKKEELSEAVRFRERFDPFIEDAKDEANFKIEGLDFAAFYVDSGSVADVEAILEEEGYRKTDIDLGSEKSLQPDPGIYINFLVGDSTEKFMFRVGFKEEHIVQAT